MPNSIDFISQIKKDIAFVVVEKRNSDNELLANFRGTGIILESSKLLTTYHVYSELTEDLIDNLFCGINISESGEKLNKYRSYKIVLDESLSSKEQDIAVFNIIGAESVIENRGISHSNFYPSLSEIENLSEGADLYISGFSLTNELVSMGLGITLINEKCILSSKKYKSMDRSLHFLLVDKNINPGASGSPVIYKDKIIGIASGAINRAQKVGDDFVNIPVGIGVVRTSNYICDLINTSN